MTTLGARHPIVAGVDLSETSDVVVAQAAALAEATGAALTLVHVAAPDPDFVGYEPGPDTVRNARAATLRDEHRRIQEIADGLRSRGLEAKALLLQGPTVETLLAEAERVGAGLIVVGSHGHGAIFRALLGSISEGVLREARCPVLVVPAPGKLGRRS